MMLHDLRAASNRKDTCAKGRRPAQRARCRRAVQAKNRRNPSLRQVVGTVAEARLRVNRRKMRHNETTRVLRWLRVATSPCRGYWLSINISRKQVERIITIACEVAGLGYGTDLKINLGP
jgi:hypothetical protein